MNQKESRMSKDGEDFNGLGRKLNSFVNLTVAYFTLFRALTLRMAEKWSTLHGWSVKECVDKYLENARRWPFFGCKLFQAQVWDAILFVAIFAVK